MNKVCRQKVIQGFCTKPTRAIMVYSSSGVEAWSVGGARKFATGINDFGSQAVKLTLLFDHSMPALHFIGTRARWPPSAHEMLARSLEMHGPHVGGCAYSKTIEINDAGMWTPSNVSNMRWAVAWVPRQA